MELTPGHLVLVLVAVLVIFGPKRLPDIGKTLGKAIREFREALSQATEDDQAPPTNHGPADRSMAEPKASSSGSPPIIPMEEQRAATSGSNAAVNRPES